MYISIHNVKKVELFSVCNHEDREKSFTFHIYCGSHVVETLTLFATADAVPQIERLIAALDTPVEQA